MSGKRSATSLAMVLIWCAALCIEGARARCRLSKYVHKAMQIDFNGRRCWDDVKIQSCWGYCLTYEISDWRFPYKESHQLVCGHEKRKHASAKLRHCDPGAQPGTDVYHYIEATSCKCQNFDGPVAQLEETLPTKHEVAELICSSIDASCEWLPPDSSLSGGLVLKEEIEEEKE